MISGSVLVPLRMVALAAALAGVVSRPAAAQSAGVVAGVVLDAAGRPVPSARVGVPALDRATLSAADGRFALRVPSGAAGPAQLVVSVAQIGFAPARVAVDAPAAGDTARLVVRLEAVAVTLADVQVTATPAGQDPLAVAQATSVLLGRELERSLGASLGATLARQPGIAARSLGPGASAPIVRGLSGDRVLVLQDGQRTGDLASTAPDHGVTIDPAAARRVEIVRGPAALLYGNNAVGGVVNVISDDIPTDLPGRLAGAATMTLESGSPGGGAQADVALPLGERGVMRVRAGGRAHDDLRLGAAAPAPRLANTYLRNANGTVGVARVGDRTHTGVAYRGYVFEYGLPTRPDPTGAPVADVTLSGERHELLGRAEWRRVGPLEALRVEGNAQWYRHDELVEGGGVGTRLALRTQWAQAVARTGAIGPFRDGALGLAALLRQNDIEGAVALTPPNVSEGFGIFFFQELPIGTGGDGDPLARRVRVPLGVRWDQHAIRSRATTTFGPARERRFGGVSASLGLTVPVAEGASLGANVARAFRSPTAEELYSRAGHAGTGAFEIGDPELGAETNTGADVVLRVERRGVAAQLSAYASEIDGYIALYPTGRDTAVSDGAGGTKRLPLHQVSQRDARLRGVEGSIEATLRQRLVVAVSGDVVRGRDAAGAPLPFLPPARLGGSLRWDDGRWSLGGGVRHAFRQGEVPAGEWRADASTLADLHAGVRLTAAGRIHSVTLRAENVGNVLYRDATSRTKDFAPAVGRNVTLVYRVVF
jgi:iron complex outermembrane receptor protein